MLTEVNGVVVLLAVVDGDRVLSDVVSVRALAPPDSTFFVEKG